jgi:hypothetical protein
MNKFNKRQSNNKIKLTESTLRNLIQESIKEALNEIGNTEASQYMLGRDASRQLNKGKDASVAFSRMSKTDKTPFGDGFNAQKRTNNGLNGLEQTGFNRYNDRNLHQLADSFYGWMFDFNDEPKQIVLDYLKYNDENSFDEIVNQYQEEIGRPLTNEEIDTIDFEMQSYWSENEHLYQDDENEYDEEYEDWLDKAQRKYDIAHDK